MLNISNFLVEMFFIGSGSMVWLYLFLNYFLEKNSININLELFSGGGSTLFIIFFIVVSYVFGIVVDRFAYLIMYGCFGKRILNKQIKEHKIDTLLIKKYNYLHKHKIMLKKNSYSFIAFEKFIRTRCNALKEKIEYNGSRLIICRAWVIHTLLILIAVGINYELFKGAALVVIAFDSVLFILLLITTRLLLKDSLVDLCESFLILHHKSNEDELDNVCIEQENSI